jgi:hypothetical protein
VLCLSLRNAAGVTDADCVINDSSNLLSSQLLVTDVFQV